MVLNFVSDPDDYEFVSPLSISSAVAESSISFFSDVASPLDTSNPPVCCFSDVPWLCNTGGYFKVRRSGEFLLREAKCKVIFKRREVRMPP